MAVIDGVIGDSEIFSLVNIPGGRFPYLGQYFSLFRPSLNGFALNYPPLYEAYGAENSTLWAQYVENHVVHAPLWTNLDSRNITGAGIWVHVFSNSPLKIQAEINEFNASVAFAVTWKHVTIYPPYKSGYKLYQQQNLSMQAIVVTDDLYTYMLNNYDQKQFSIQPLRYTTGNFTGKIPADRKRITNLRNESNVNQGELRKEYPFAIGAEYKDIGKNTILEDGFRQCCSAVNSRCYCHLNYDVNPPDDCSSWSAADKGVVKRAVSNLMSSNYQLNFYRTPVRVDK